MYQLADRKKTTAKTHPTRYHQHMYGIYTSVYILHLLLTTPFHLRESLIPLPHTRISRVETANTRER